MFTQSMHSQEFPIKHVHWVHCSTVVYSVAQFDLDVDIVLMQKIPSQEPDNPQLNI